MKVLFEPKEMFEIVKKSIPKDLIPPGYEIDTIEEKTYPVRHYELSFIKEEKQEAES